jgi:HAD superfamily hydrolase (TIGR01509 family)
MFHGFDLYLFDFDGLLVNTEEVHFQAYREACRQKNLSLSWTFYDFCRHAHYSAIGIREALSKIDPLLKDDLEWKSFYHLKTESYLLLLKAGQVHLMPGVEKFLSYLIKNKSLTCVVTHSTRSMIESIRNTHPLLQKIDHWITREDYKEPKPSPDGYLTAMERYLKPHGKAIGFEDSLKGLESLIKSGAKAIWVTPIEYPEMEEKLQQGVLVYPTFEKIVADTLHA